MCLSPGGSELRTDQPGDRHVVRWRAALRAANGMLAIRRGHQARDLLQHQPMSPGLPRRSLRGRLRGGARSHAQTHG